MRSALTADDEEVVEDELAEAKSDARVVRSLCNEEIAVLTLVEDVELALGGGPGGGGGMLPGFCVCMAWKNVPRSLWNAVRSLVDVEAVEEVEVELEEKSDARAVRSLCSAEIAVLKLVESLDDVELEDMPQSALISILERE